MIDRNNYTRGTIHVPNNGIAVVCHREKQKNNKKIPTYYKQTRVPERDPFAFQRRGVREVDEESLNSALRSEHSEPLFPSMATQFHHL